MEGRHGHTVGMAGPLNDEELATFASDGFVRLTHAFPRALADECCDLLWEQLPAQRDVPATWQRPLISVAASSESEFVESLTTPRLAAALDQLIGEGGWLRPASAGPFMVRFPSQADPGDTGWYADGCFERGDGDVPGVPSSRVLTVLSLFTDVAADDAPVRLRRGSHLVADTASEQLEVAYATGRAGDVYLCHPSLAHAASYPLRGNRPRVIAQQPLVAPN